MNKIHAFFYCLTCKNLSKCKRRFYPGFGIIYNHSSFTGKQIVLTHPIECIKACKKLKH